MGRKVDGLQEGLEKAGRYQSVLIVWESTLLDASTFYWLPCYLGSITTTPTVAHSMIETV